MPKAEDGFKICSREDCSLAGVKQPVENFHKNKGACDGLHYACSSCNIKNAKLRRASGAVGRAQTRNGLSKYLKGVRSRAKKKGLQMTLTEDYLKTIDMPEFCPYLGIKLVWFVYTSGNNDRGIFGAAIDRASLDRIDSTKGYIEGNVRWVSSLFNKMKYILTDQELKEYCKRIVAAIEKEEQNAKLHIPMHE